MVVTNEQKGMRVGAPTPPATLTGAQWDLTFGVYKVQNWRESWFTAITDTDGWITVERLLSPRARPGAVKKMLLIPRMMGCDYGVKLYWFLTLAIYVVKECESFSQENDYNPMVDGVIRECWNRLRGGLRGGSNTVLQVMRSLVYTHFTVGDNISSDEFYRNLMRIHHFLSTAQIPQDNNYVNRIDGLLDSLQDFLSFNCAPEYPQFDINQLMTEHETGHRHFCSYVFYLNKMDSYVKYVNERLIQLGFLYDERTGQTTFKEYFIRQ